MIVHLHRARKWMAWAFGILAVLPFTMLFELSAGSPKSRDGLAVVTGRVTYSGRPLRDMILCLDTEPGVHSAYSNLGPDGEFHLGSMDAGADVAFPGTYHAHFLRRTTSPALPAKYCDASSAGIEIEVPASSSDLDIDLP